MENTQLPPFDPNGEQSGIFPRWERWLRAVDLYLTSKNITDATRKKATLLHMGGLELQDIYYAIPDADTVAEGEDAYNKTKDALTAYFKPKVNKTYERHIFRGLAQKDGETVIQFITRLRQQARYCEFTSEDDEIRDQVVDKCNSTEIKKRILEKGDITLKEVTDIAQAFEVMSVRVKNMEPENVAKLTEKKQKVNKQQHKTTEKRCYRCGYVGHYKSDKNCPAKDKTCSKCKKEGHFAAVCRTKTAQGVQAGATSTRKLVPGQLRSLHEVHEDDGYTFHLVEAEHINRANEENGKHEENVEVYIGGVPVNVLIDSGAKCNVINEKCWSYLKGKQIKCKSRQTDRKIFPYGQSNALQLIGEFDCVIKAGQKEVDANFVVAKGDGRALLGYPTAKALGIIKIGTELQVNNMIVVGKGDTGIGKLKDFQLKLPIDPSFSPIAQPLRRVPFKIRDQIREQIDELLRQDIIEKVEGPTPWVSPVVPVYKDTGKFRLCVDMRLANQAIVRERFPLPIIEEFLYKVRGSNFFSTLDIRDAYHQIELDEKSREITTFVVDSGLYRYKRLMFGLNCAPEMFQRILRSILQNCEGVENFLDDIIVFGKTKEEHDRRLRKVRDTLEGKGLKLNDRKCVIGRQEIKFLGFHISGQGYRPLESKIGAVQNFRRPETPDEIRGFLGLVNFCSSFIPGLSQLSEPLRKLTRSSEKFEWTDVQERSFCEIKRLMGDAKTLGIYDTDAPTRVIADAGPDAVGAVVVQKGPSGWRPIGYASKSLSDPETRYSQTEKEALALVFACERFHLWLYGIEFELVTDHKALEYLFTPKSKPNARIERWILRLQPYSYKIKYEKGCTNIADPLSRLVKVATKQEKEEVNRIDYVYAIARESVPKAMSLSEIDCESQKDVTLIEVRHAVNTGKWDTLKNTRFKLLKDELCVYKNIVLRGTRIVIPLSLRNKVLGIAHEGHPGIVAMKNRLRSKVWWDGMDKDAEKCVKSCHGCQLVQKSVVSAPLYRNELPDRPWDTLAMDLLGPLPNKDNLLVVIDYYSRYYEVVITQSTTSNAIIGYLSEIFARHGFPCTLICDNGPQLASAEIDEWAKGCGIAIKHSAPLWPQANGEVERQNRSLLKRLKIAHAEKQNLRDELLTYLLMYRSTPHTTTGVSPAELLFGRKIRTKLPDLNDKILLDEELREKDALQKMRGKDYYDKRNRVQDCNLRPGETVLLNKSKENKLSPEFDATKYQIINKKGNTVTVKSPSGNVFTRNASMVKKYISNDDQLPETPHIKTEVESDSEPELNEANDSIMRNDIRERSASPDLEKSDDLNVPELNVTNRPKRKHKLPSRYEP